MSLKPNPECDDHRCIKKQREYQEYLEANPVKVEPKKEKVPVSDVANEWGISILDETDPELLTKDDLTVAKGIKIAYTIPEKAMALREDDAQVTVDDSVSLDDLMGQMKNL